MARHFDFQIGEEPLNAQWPIPKNDDGVLRFQIVEDSATMTPKDITGWTFEGYTVVNEVRVDFTINVLTDSWVKFVCPHTSVETWAVGDEYPFAIKWVDSAGIRKTRIMGVIVVVDGLE